MSQFDRPYEGRITWIDPFIRPGRGYISIFGRSILLAAATYLVGIAVLIATGNSALILHPLIVASAVGIAWVCSMSFMIPWNKRLLNEARSDFIWRRTEERDKFLLTYLNYINGDFRSVLFGLAGWVVLMSVVYLLTYTPERLEFILPKIGKPISIGVHQREPFLISVGIVTLVGSILALTSARYVWAQTIYARSMRAAAFTSPVARLREHLTAHINNTAFAGVAFTSGLVVILFALELNARNIIVILSATCVLAIAIASYLLVVYCCEEIYRKVTDEALPVWGDATRSGDQPPLMRELASLAQHSLSKPLIDRFTLVKTLFSISIPISLKVFEVQLRVLLSILLD